MVFKCPQSLKFSSRLAGLLLLLTLSGSRLARALPLAPSQEGVTRLTPAQAIAVALGGLATAPVSAAAYPEAWANDFRLSDMGPNGDTNYGARYPAVAYNSTDNEYLVVWSGDDNEHGMVDNEYEIFGQRVDAATGAELGTDRRLSSMGASSGDDDYDAYQPAATCNSTNRECLVVWVGDDNTGGLVNNEYEIFGQWFTNVDVYLPLVMR